MMGHTHAVSGMAAGAATLPLLTLDSAWAQLAYVAVSGGMAYFPDWDHQSSTISVMWGPFSRLVHEVLTRIFRGHRGGMHDVVVAPLLFGGLAYAASWNRYVAMVVLAIAIGATLRALHFVIPGNAEKSWPINLAASWASAWWLSGHAAGELWWLPIAVAVGIVLHIAGDALTKSCVPRPFSWLDGQPDGFGTGPLRTNTWYEEWLIAPGLLITTAVLLYLNVPEITEALGPAVQPLLAVLTEAAH